MTNTPNILTTPAYMAPEMTLGSSTPKVDMWALGVIVYRFFSNRLPFKAVDLLDTMKLIKENEPAPLPSTLSPFVRLTISQLLNKNPENRPNAK
jgi:eukaryotic-like serine/threonine-protein kinase